MAKFTQFCNFWRSIKSTARNFFMYAIGKWNMGVTTGGQGGSWSTHLPPNFNFRTKQGPTVSVWKIRDIAFYEFSEILRSRNFTISTVYTTIFGQFTAAFHFFQLHRGNRSLQVGLSEKVQYLTVVDLLKFLIVDHTKENHNEREFTG